MADITAIILTKDEELNITDCILSIQSIVKRIVVIDSFSNDKTVELARELGAEVYQNVFINHSKQFIYGLSIGEVKTKWVMRIDADERLTKESAAEIDELCRKNADTDVNGIVLRFEVNFMGRPLKHGGIYPFRKMVVFQYGKAYMEERNMDEHIVLSEGRSVETKYDSIHKDYKDLTFWVNKHNLYSDMEVLDYFSRLFDMGKSEGQLEKRARTKRFIKFKLYYKLPMGMRAHLYYWYRYYVKFGFLDGREGKIFAFMQAYWYRYLVDAKIYEKKLEQKRNVKK